jgi:ethanolaminephosphotransferase
MGYISKKGLINLANWKYEGAPYTPLENLLNPFWNWAASYIPNSVAPNAVTLSALIGTTSAVVAVLVHDSTYEKELPWYLYFWGGLGIFAF